MTNMGYRKIYKDIILLYYKRHTTKIYDNIN